jgi:hypothetical protein
MQKVSDSWLEGAKDNALFKIIDWNYKELIKSYVLCKKCNVYYKKSKFLSAFFSKNKIGVSCKLLGEFSFNADY